MMLTHIVAMSSSRVIGKENRIPWKQKADMERFKTLTLNHPVIMGRKTFESILARLGKPLPRRENIILTRSARYHPQGAVSIQEDGLAYYLERSRREEVFVIGGSEIYALTLPYTNRIVMTIVDTTIQGDAFYPELDRTSWISIGWEHHLNDEANEYPYTYLEYSRRN